MTPRRYLKRFCRDLGLRVKQKVAMLKGYKRPDVPDNLRGTIMIARVIGNDLYPRHVEGQMLNNLRFILGNEPKFPGVIKLFILNRLFDQALQSEALQLIADHDAEALVLPFVPDEYAALGWDIEPFGTADFFSSPEFLEYDRQMQMRMKIWACGPKMRYAMGVNSARNAGITAGKERAEWTAVLDGNCMFTEASFEQFRKDCRNRPFTPYKIVPMQRLEDNADFWSLEPDQKSSEEPQIAFHYTATGAFDERFPYGLRNKTSFLSNLGVPGAWQDWSVHKWMPSENQRLADKYWYSFVRSAVFRLSSGGNGLEHKHANKERYQSRNLAILTTVCKLNELYGTAAPELAKLIVSIPNDDPRLGA